MKQALLAIYHRLPVGMRSVPASLWGYRLQSQRYGAETDRLMQEAIERETWSDERWRGWREERLAKLLHDAATRVPYYRDLWSRRRAAGDHASVERLENWPVLEKSVVQGSPEALVSENVSRRSLHEVATSGTTSKPLRLIRSLAASREWYALFEARCRSWNGVSRHSRWGMLGGQIVVPATSTKPPYWLWNSGMRQLYVSTYHLAPTMVSATLDELARRRIEYLIGYSSSLYLLAKGALAAGRRDIRMKTVITNAEPLFDHQRDAIREAFGCPARESYGMAEMAAGASECEHGRLHVWPDAGVLEVAGAEGIQPFGEGDLICTGLINDAMPLIRYRVGDRGVVPQQPGNCKCGRTLPVIDRVEGRNSDLLVTRDGRRIFWLNPVFYGLPVLEAQIIQESISLLRVRLVTDDRSFNQARAMIRERLQERLGDVDIEFERVAKVPRTPAGKFRPVICKLAQEEIEAIEAQALRGAAV